MADEIFIGDITGGTEITLITFAKSGDKVTIKTNAIEGSKDKLSLFVEPMKSGDKFLAFTNPNVTASLLLDGLVYYFFLDSVSIVKYKGHPVHMLTCKTPKGPVNRREHVRVAIGADAVVIMNGDIRALQGYMHDISCSGLAFNLRGQHDVPAGTDVRISFSYAKHNDEVTYVLAGKAIHSQYDEERQFTKVGVWFTREYPKVNALIAYLQREELRKIRHEDQDEKRKVRPLAGGDD